MLSTDCFSDFNQLICYLWNLQDLETLAKNAIPKGIALGRDLDLTQPLGKIYQFSLVQLPDINLFSIDLLDEFQLMDRIQEMAKKNKVWRSFIGMGYYNCHVPHPILRNLFENPGW